ncbi:N-6 DNA methylase [Plantactinospora solaniradicis]|uniref:N-6 DNA methylase n=1 Tax=Plantactinospora solaniradicis TaxID=1723736 RepID=A0ABW1KD14_9ACTN
MDGILRGVLSAEDRVNLLLTLIHRRVRQPEDWAGLAAAAQDPNGHSALMPLVAHMLLPSADGDRNPHRWLYSLRDTPTARQALSQLILTVDGALAADAADRKTPGRSAAAGVFDLILNQWAMGEGQKGHQFFTPRPVVRLGVHLLSATGSANRIYDPYCRAGGFLEEVVTRLASDPDKPDGVEIYGTNPDPEILGIAAMNLALHGVDARLETTNPVDGPTSSDTRRRFDLVFTNPPFNMYLNHDPDLGDRHWPYGSPPKRNANFAWLQHVASALDVGGRGAVLMANNAAVSANGREQDIRAAMVEDSVVECLIALPARLFSSTGIPVTMWILKHPAERLDEILLIDASEMGTMASRTLRSLTDEDISGISEIYRDWRDGRRTAEPVRRHGAVAASVPLTEIRRQGYLLHPSTYVAVPQQEPKATDARSDLANAATDLHRLVARASEVDSRVAALIAEITG